MKRLSEHSANIFIKLIKLMEGKEHLKLDNSNGTFMPVSIEKLYKTKIGEAPVTCYSITHYYEQNGDLVPDPDMTFFVHDSDNSLIYPASFQNSMFYRQAIFQKDGKWFINHMEQEDEVSFANLWLMNIKEQQEIEI